MPIQHLLRAKYCRLILYKLDCLVTPRSSAQALRPPIKATPEQSCSSGPKTNSIVHIVPP